MRIVIVGSLCMDLVVTAPRRPRKGETLLGHSFGMFCGGKGFNQAIAAARMGASVAMVGRTGDDLFSDAFHAALANEGIDASHVGRDSGCATGVGTPVIDADGDNSIILVPGANMRLTPDHVDAASELLQADALLLQLEIPQETSRRAAAVAQAAGATVILDPAPAAELDAGLLAGVDLLVPNEIEAAALTGEPVDDLAGAERAAHALLARGESLVAVIVTLGERGAVVVDRERATPIAAPAVAVVDTTGAGDAFRGALATELVAGRSLRDAAELACRAGSQACTVLGAEPSMPRREAL